MVGIGGDHMREGSVFPEQSTGVDNHLGAAPNLSSSESVSVVIVTFFTGPLLWRSIQSALEQAEVKEVIVVDNGNWPATMAELVDMAALDPRLKLVTGQGNVGFAAGCNLGARAAEGRYLFILNPDAVLPAGAVGSLLTEGHKASDGQPWVIGGRLVNPDGTEQAGARRRTLTPWTALVEMLRLDRFAPKHPYFLRFNRHEAPCPGKTVRMPVISGACMLMPRNDYFAIGGMDEGYFLHAEDIDFCLRFEADGGYVLFTPEADILHMKSSSRISRVRVERWKAQSLVRYFRRHYPTQYPMGFVSSVCCLVWVGFAVRAARAGLASALSFLGVNRRWGLGGVRRAVRVMRRTNNR